MQPSQTLDEFMNLMDSQLEKIRNKFLEKNESYGQDGDVFFNFRSMARRVCGDNNYSGNNNLENKLNMENMFTVLLILMDKHLVAIANKGLAEREFNERMIDIIVYSLIAMGMRAEWEKYSKGAR